MESAWQYKFVSSLSHAPKECMEAFLDGDGWHKLGPAASQRCDLAWHNPGVGLAWYMTLAPMLSYKFTLVGMNAVGMTLCRLRQDVSTRCLVRPVKGTQQLSVHVEPVDDDEGQWKVSFYTMGGDTFHEKLVRGSTRWGSILRNVRQMLCRTNIDSHRVKFVSKDGILMTAFHDKVAVRSKICPPQTSGGKMVKSKFGAK